MKTAGIKVYVDSVAAVAIAAGKHTH